MNILQNIIETETYKSILYFVLGGLFSLFTYHLFRYYNTKKLSYLLYSFYCLCSFAAYIPLVENGFLEDFANHYHWDVMTKDYLTTVYNCIYFLFFTAFLDLKKINSRFYHWIIYPVLAILVLSSVFFAVAHFTDHPVIYKNFIGYFTLYICGLTVFSFIILMRIRNPLKWYIIVGGIMLFITSMIGEKVVREFLNIDYKTGDFVFFVGLLVENTLFGLALGHQQRTEYRERVGFQENLVRELKNNETLRKEIAWKNEEKLIAENEKIKIERENTELALAALRSQINPHFIFNTLNSIKLYILSNDPENAANYLQKFSRLIRLILNASFQRNSSLETELEIIKLYVAIENLRFNNEIVFTIHQDSKMDLHLVPVPPLFLQPYLENAIWHGITSTEKKEISITVSERSDYIEITIEDSGVGIKNSKHQNSSTKRKSYGTKIAADSLNQFFNSNVEILTEDLGENSSKSSGTKVTIRIPINQKGGIENLNENLLN